MRKKSGLMITILLVLGYLVVDNLYADNESEYQLGRQFHGAYITDCKHNPETNTSSNTYLNISSSSVSGVMRLYEGATCLESNLVMKQVAKFNISVVKKKGTTVIVKQSVDYSDVTFLSDHYVSVANESRAFNYSDWVMGEAKNVTEEFQAQIKEDSEYSEYSCLKVEGNKLYSIDYWLDEDRLNSDKSKIRIYSRVETIITRPLRSVFNGRYVSECIESDDEKSSFIQKIKIENSSLEVITSEYIGRFCREPDLRGTKTEIFNLAVVGFLKDNTVIKQTLVSSKMVYLTENAVADANDNKLYGFSDWAKDIEKDITDAQVTGNNKDRGFTDYIFISDETEGIGIGSYWISRGEDNDTSVRTIYKVIKDSKQKLLPSEYDGLYSSACMKEDDFYFKVLLELNDSEITTEVRVYLTNTCENNEMQYKLKNVRKYTQEGYQDEYFTIRGTVVSISITPMTQAITDEWNQKFMSGVNDWKVDVERQLTKLLDEGRTIYMNLKLEQNKLFLNANLSDQDIDISDDIVLTRIEN